MFGRRLMLAGAGMGAVASASIFFVKQDSARAAVATEADPSLLSNSNAFLPRMEGPKWNFNWDLRDPETLISVKEFKKIQANEGEAGIKKLVKEKTAKASRHILLIRHGQYNLDGRCDKERILTKLGREQARETGKRLAALGYVFDRVVHSTQTRATETANIILEELEPAKVLRVQADSLIEEGTPYPVEPPVGRFKQPFRVMRDGSRIEAGFRSFFHRAFPEQEKDSFELLVCHANVSRYYLCRAMQFPPEAWLRMSKAHGSITWITIRPNGRVILRSFADSGHMPKDMVTYS